MSPDPDYFNQGSQQEIEVIDIPNSPNNHNGNENKIPDNVAPGEVLNNNTFVPKMYYFTADCPVYENPKKKAIGTLGANVRLKITDMVIYKGKKFGFSKNRKLWLELPEKPCK